MATAEDRFREDTGAYVQPGVGTAYPELPKMLLKLYKNRVSKLPFVPVGWLSRVQAELDSGNVVLLYQSKPNGRMQPNSMPTWITNDPAAIDAWQAAAEIVRDAYTQFAMQKVEEGKAIVARADANAALWDTLYKGSVAIRDAPGNAVAAVGKGALSFLGSFLKSAWWVIALVAVGAFVWFNRGDIARAANAKARKAAGL